MRVVDAWIARWLAGGGWSAMPAFVHAPDEDWPTLRQGEGIDLTGRPSAVHDLAFAILGVGARNDLTQADDKLVRRVAAAALDDLHEAVGAACPMAAPDGPRWRLTIGSLRNRSLAIDCAEGMLAAMARRTFTPVARPAILSSRRDALARQEVACAAHLGTSALSVQQIGALEPGDIILLDRPLSDSVPLAIAGRLSDCCVSLGTNGATINVQE